MEENFEQMLNEFEKEKKEKIKTGRIVDIQDGTVFVDIQEKVEGVLPKKEIENTDFKIGDDIPVVVTKKTKKGESVLSYKLAMNDIKRKEFMQKYKVGDVVRVKIVGVNKGGFVATNEDNIEFFIPKSESGLQLSDEYKGKKVDAVIIEIKKNSIVLSRKKYLQEKKAQRKEFVETIKDKVVQATVKGLKKDGIIIDVDGWGGFVPQEEVSFKKVSHFKLFNKEDKVNVKLIDPEKMLFSIKATQTDPWQEVIDNKITTGDVLNVTVTNIKDYGAFVDIGNGVEGFLHISEISWDSQAQIDDVLNVGDEIDVEVTELDLDNKRLRVSYKSLLPKPAETFAKNHNEGDVVEGKVVNVTDIGGFVDVDGIVCFIPNRFVSWTKGEKASEILNIDDVYAFKVISISPDENKVILSKKDAEDSPYVAFAKEHQVGDTIKGIIKNIADFGVFVSLGNGVEALVRKENLEKDIQEYNEGDELEGEITELDAQTKRVKLAQK
ncbi:MAG: S1 RNA-binding domain-containing protein [Epsilonproteobacteria bacterium]|nr:S1 RNA-binding domain-containing protein [Campylobacterota bacterium]